MNVTLSVDDQILDQARQLAQRQGTSLDQIVSEYLEVLTATDKAAAKLESLQNVGEGGSGGKPWSRADMPLEEDRETPRVSPHPKPSDVFRETFLLLLDQENLSAFRGFAEAIFSLSLESARYRYSDWDLEPSEVYPAEEFFAVIADLRHCQRYVSEIMGPDDSIRTSRLELAGLFTRRISAQLGEIADRIERGVRAGFVEKD